MGAHGRMLRRQARSACACPDCNHPRDVSRQRAEDVVAAGREMQAQWSEALDLMAGICPTCRHPFEAARPDGGDGVYRWCGIAECRCAHHEMSSRDAERNAAGEFL